MELTIQADENGALVVPAGCLGQVEPGARFTVEARGDEVILRREPPAAAPALRDEAAARIARLRQWIASFPPGPAIPLEATRRDTMYD